MKRARRTPIHPKFTRNLSEKYLLTSKTKQNQFLCSEILFDIAYVKR